jgi:glycosyltransferase involved in cell wall biosynthesis
MELCNIPLIGQRTKPVIDLSGVVYTSIFNPTDGRKNWDDLLTAFLIGLKEQDDALLVLKLIGRDRHNASEILARYRGLDLRHRCRVAIITDYLSAAEMLDLTRASTYYVTSTRAEGNCLPLMNFLAAGRPGITPCHTAIADYFSDRMGFVVESHAEPCAWPHDPQLRSRSTWHRLVWPSLVEAFRESYRVARSEPARMRDMSDAARNMSWERHHPNNVLPSLAAALDQVLPISAARPIRRAA